MAQTATCPSPIAGASNSCSIGTGTYTGIAQLTATGSTGSGSTAGGAGPTFTFTNAGTFLIDGVSQYWGMYLHGTGGQGSTDPSGGGAGGNITITNNGTISFTGTNSIGSTLFGIHGRLDGGAGGTNPGGAGNNDGGHGGASGPISITNAGTISITQPAGNGAVGIYARAGGGTGGNQDSGVGDQAGGAGGNAQTITIHNTGSIALGSASAPLAGHYEAWGIGTEAVGASGGLDNGAGGQGGVSNITNNGSIAINWNPQDGTPNGVRGIYALSHGGSGTTSNDNSDPGGAGAPGVGIIINHNGSIVVTSGPNVTGLSGGIVATSRGGDGGDAPGKNSGGAGGAASVATNDAQGYVNIALGTGASIVATGYGIAGIVGQSLGGRGGNGQNGDNDSSGGNGGAGGAVDFYLGQSASIMTVGVGAYGIVGQSIGGQGGNGGNASGVAGTAGGGGFGGNAGAISAYLDTSSTVTTRGDFSGGVVAHSVGGGGGTGGDFTDVLGGGAGNGGNGGNGGDVVGVNLGGIITSGRHSYGMLVQSIGGSGGTGGIATGLVLQLGGDGASGGTAGTAYLQNGGSVVTFGYGSHGIVAQSISGGGGAAGTAGGVLAVGGSGGGSSSANGNTVTVSTTNEIFTGGNAAIGIVAQSIGGGGGSGAGGTGIVSVGGSGSAGGSGGAVYVYLYGGFVHTGGTMSHGVMAQSIGGGGGNGGDVMDLSAGVPSVGIGGSASIGGNGGTVCLTNTTAGCTTDSNPPIYYPTEVRTTGNNAIGIVAQSIGGGGGNGGNATGAEVVGLGTFQVGGSAGAGGSGVGVTLGFEGLTLTTFGSHAAGIVAQSIGGGGGTGGSASGYSAGIGFTSAVAVGGSGGSGGGSGTVSVTLTGSIVRTGQNGGDVTDAIGILAQSISGGGGSGGSSVADALTAAVPTGEDVSLAMTITTAVGGSGGSGGTAGNVNVTLDGTSVATLGTGSHGVVAQSIGGGGGNGGSASSFAATAGIANTVSADIGVSVGASGAQAGHGGNVTVALHNGASIATAGDYANAIVVQTIGGGGGNGGAGSVDNRQIGGGFNLTATVGLGGAGSSGGAGGNATVTLDQGTTITTMGSGARGLLVQSIGGGGGASQGASVGLSGSGGSEETGDITASIGVSVGRSGSGGGAGGTITVTMGSDIVTSGGDADGVLLQSIGGGGGLGGSVASATPSSLDVLDDGSSSYGFTVGVGGTGGAAADGGPVTVTHSGRITTTGDWADGIVVQSLGGGGGVGGSASMAGSQATANIVIGVGGSGGIAGQGGAVSITFDDSHGNKIVTSGYSAHGVVLQSIGGGGGQGGDGSDKATGRITVGGAVGGSGGTGSNGGSVSASGWIDIDTHGDDAHGIVAQSIGGGGGIGGAGSSTAADDGSSHTIDLAVGGHGTGGASGGTVNLTFGTNLNTYGDRAIGVVAQSIGGGGGIGGAGSKDNITSLVLGSTGGGGGGGGTVTVDITNQSVITTSGAAAHGIVAQSIGGGGGIGGEISGVLLDDRPSLRGGSQGGGSGGNVSVTVDGNISTGGNAAFGIIAQSIGAGGGLGGDAQGAYAGSTGTLSGSGGTVTVVQSAGRSIRTSGADSVGIFAQSQGPDGNAAVSVTVNGTVTGGSGSQGAGVWVSSGKYNVMTVGAGGSISAASGLAIRYTGDASTSFGSTLTVTNFGSISGNVTMSNTDSNAAGFVNNESGGTLSDAAIYQADVVNRGRMHVGGTDRIDDTRITGGFTQHAGGVLALNADFAAASIDRLTIDGNASLAGRVEVRAASVLPGFSLSFLTAGGTLTHSLSPTSAIFDYAIAQSGNGLSLAAQSAHFAQPGFALNGPQGGVAAHLQAIWNAGGGQFGGLFGTLGTLADTDADGYGAALSDISAGTAGAAAVGSIVATQQRLDLLLSCPMFSGGSAFLVETSCVWSQAGAQKFDQSGKGGVSGFDTTTYTLQAGAQFEVAPNWFVGFAGGYDRARIRGDDSRTDADGDILYAGASLKHQLGPWLLSGAIAGSYGWYDSKRRIGIPGFEAQAKGDPAVYNVSARLRAAYTFAAEQFYVRPLVDLDLVYTHAKGYRESGAGLLDLAVKDESEFSIHATPALELGTRVKLGQSMVIRAFARAGVTFSDTGDWKTSARLANAPAGAGSFESEVPLAKIVGRVAAGVDLASGDGFTVRAQYQGSFSDTYTSHGGSLRLAYHW